MRSVGIYAVDDVSVYRGVKTTSTAFLFISSFWPYLDSFVLSALRRCRRQQVLLRGRHKSISYRCYGLPPVQIHCTYVHTSICTKNVSAFSTNNTIVNKYNFRSETMGTQALLVDLKVAPKSQVSPFLWSVTRFCLFFHFPGNFRVHCGALVYIFIPLKFYSNRSRPNDAFVNGCNTMTCACFIALLHVLHRRKRIWTSYKNRINIYYSFRRTLKTHLFAIVNVSLTVR